MLLCKIVFSSSHKTGQRENKTASESNRLVTHGQINTAIQQRQLDRQNKGSERSKSKSVETK